MSSQLLCSLYVHVYTLGYVSPVVTNFLSLLCCSDTEAQCEVMQEIVDQVLEVRGNLVLRDNAVQSFPPYNSLGRPYWEVNSTFPSPDEPF